MTGRRPTSQPDRKAASAEAPAAKPKARRRASHSMEAVLSETVALLDQAGESALTFRALAARLGTGVGSIYWYVDNKDELLDRATDHVLQGVLADVERFVESDDPIGDLRAIAVTLFDAIVYRPWLGAYFMRDTGVQPNGLLIYERLGEQVLRLGLNPRQSFYAVSAVLGFVIGIAADLGQEPPQVVLDGTTNRDEFIARYADQWRQLDPQTFPFVHHIVDEFAIHDDTDQFRAGLDLLLAGLRLQSGH
jgi:AcrR family transcriptional regulator